MQTTHYLQDAVMAKIDLGGGCLFEIMRQAPVESRFHGKRFQTAPTSRPVDSVLHLAEELYQARSSPSEVDRTVNSSRYAGLDDDIIEDMARIAVEWMRGSHLKAYYLLRATYAISRQRASFWRHALTSCMLGFLLLRNLNRPVEAIPILEDFETTTKILTRYLGARARSQYLTQVAEQGLQEAHAASGRQQSETESASAVAEKIWLIFQGSPANPRACPELCTRAEGFARAAIFLSDRNEQAGPEVWDQLTKFARNQLSAVACLNEGSLQLSAMLPLIGVCGILEICGHYEHILEILEPINADDSRLPVPVVAAIVNRKAIAHHSLGRDQVASQLLDGTAISNLQKLVGGSIDAQTEALLYHLIRAEISRSQEDLSASKHWENACKVLIRSLEQWSQVPSCNRMDDLRVLHVAILKERARPILDRIVA